MSISRLSAALAIAVVAAVSVSASPSSVLAQSSARMDAPQSGRDRLTAWLNQEAARHTAARRDVVAAITTEDQARARQARVRALLSEMIEFETASGPVVSGTSKVLHEDGFDIEALWYESLPGYRVTANLYRPTTGAGPYPAIIVQPGHGVDGKISNYGFAANFARAGFIVLAIDIVGEGERLQHFDPEIGASKVGRPTGEHSMGFGQSLPTGGHVSRYFIQDAMRGVDYLMARPDVDDQRIGAFGCSGGGTMTAYLAALDPRIKATASACYVNDFDHLLAPGETGAQDAEQSIPFFLERGLDLPDWIELAAPRPYAIVSTTEDMFPIAGARAAYAEARRFYAAMNADDRITMIEGPGGHGNLGPVAPQILAFFSRWLKDDVTPPVFTPVAVGDASRLRVTETGQLSSSIGSETLQSLARAQADRERPNPPAEETDSARLARLRVAIRDITRTRTAPGDTVQATLSATARHNGFQSTPVTLSVGGMDVMATFATDGAPGRKPSLLLLGAPPSTTLEGLFATWTRAGWNVLALEPRGAGGAEEIKSPLTGDWTLLSLRTLLVGRTPVGLRIDDTIAAINWLSERPDVDPRGVAVHGPGALGPVALHAAVLDDRIGQVTTIGSIVAYREFVDRPISRDMAEVNLPGVLRRYDLPDLMEVLGDRLILVNPANAIGEPLSAVEAAQVAPAATVVFRNARDPAAPPSSSRQ